MNAPRTEPDLKNDELPVLFQIALGHAREAAVDDLDQVLTLTRVYEEIALRAQIDQRKLASALSSPDQQTYFFRLIAHGAATVGGLLVQSLEAEEKKDDVQREKVDEMGARLQAVTVVLAKLGASKELTR